MRQLRRTVFSLSPSPSSLVCCRSLEPAGPSKMRGVCPSPSGSRTGLREGQQLGRGHTARWWDQSWQTPEPQDPSREGDQTGPGGACGVLGYSGLARESGHDEAPLGCPHAGDTRPACQVG